VLEAAHIIPYQGAKTNHPSNGLLLRADVHTLFDLGLVAVDTKRMTILVSSRLQPTEYSQYAGRLLALPTRREDWPSTEALDSHRETFS
jgi:predicted restriction endonuclease